MWSKMFWCQQKDFSWKTVPWCHSLHSTGLSWMSMTDMQCWWCIIRCTTETITIEVDRFGMICKRVTHLNVTYSTKGSRAERSAYVYAKWWANTNSFEEPITDPLSEPRPAIIKQFLIVNVMSKGAAFKHVVTKVSWLHPHPDWHFYGKPVEVWSLQGTDTSHPASFFPVERIAGRCVVNTSTVQLSNTRERKTVVMPLCMLAEI